MKKYLTPLLLLIISGCGEKIMDDGLLVEKNLLKYKPGSDSPFTGRVISNYESGSERLRGAYTNGAMDGIWIFWKENGEKEKAKVHALKAQNINPNHEAPVDLLKKINILEIE